MPRLSIDLDEATFRAFSVKCAELGLKKAQVVRGLIKKWLEEHQAEVPQAPRASNSDRPMTERQRAYIQSLIRRVSAETGLEPSQLREMAETEMGFKISEDMSMAEASKLIDWLKGWLSEASQE